MKVFCVTPQDTDYDQYDEVTVVAETKERAIEIAREENYFEKNQGELSAEEIDITTKGIIATSFCAG